MWKRELGKWYFEAELIFKSDGNGVEPDFIDIRMYNAKTRKESPCGAMLHLPALDLRFKAGCNENDLQPLLVFIDMLKEDPSFRLWAMVHER